FLSTIAGPRGCLAHTGRARRASQVATFFVGRCGRGSFPLTFVNSGANLGSRRAIEQAFVPTMTNRGHRLTLEKITQHFGDAVAVSDINLDIQGGELVAILGPSGCGKTTLLRIISGFIRQSQGRVLFDGQPVDDLSPSQRGVGIVFQNYALFPHMTVAENVAYGLQA